jgi:hypothetical protein
LSNVRLYRENVTLALALPEAFADWEAPTAAELNNSDLVFNITCALNEDGTTFNLADSDTDDSLSFCQAAGSISPTLFNAEVVFEAFRSLDPTNANTANEAFGLMAFPDVEYFAIQRIGKESDVNFAIGDRVSMVRVKTDFPVDVAGAGENIRIQNNFLFQGDINWNFEVVSGS